MTVIPMASADQIPDFSSLLLAAELDSMHLQWFANPEAEGRTEEPTRRKLEKAREEGKVARSPDVSGAITLIASVVTVAIVSGFLFRTFQDLLRYFFSRVGQIDVTTDIVLFEAVYRFFIRLALPVSAVAFVGAIVGNLAQVGFLFTTKPLQPDLKRIAPKFGEWAKRSLFSTEAVYNLFKAMGKVIIIVGVAYINIASRFGELAASATRHYADSFFMFAQLGFSLLLQVAIILLVLSLVDYWFQRKQHRDQLKMTKQEVREERKTEEGDPMIRQRIRERMRQLLRQNLVAGVQRADVVITNPTHYAVALEYKRDSMSAPTVTAKGEDEIAFRIRRLAREYSVELVENKPLARALYAEVEVGEEIPGRYYEAVATVIRQVYRMRGAATRAAGE